MSDEPSDEPADWSADQAAEFATGDGHARGEPSDEPVDDVFPGETSTSTPWYQRAIRSTSPSPPIEQVGGLDDVREHWQRYGFRGIQKLGNVDDQEAWVDLLKFVLGFALNARDGSEGDTEPDTDGASDDDVAGAVPPLPDDVDTDQL